VDSHRFLLKTFSINTFQGQYPNMAVRINSTPTDPSSHRKTPEMKKARIINTTPMINRKTPSPFPTFFTFTAGFSLSNSSAINKTKTPFLSQKWSLNSSSNHIPPDH
jgi:hypothetical protein